MEGMPVAVAQRQQSKGGWVWLLLPLLLMFAGSNIVFGLFLLRLGDVAAASEQTQAVGPVTWSVLQLVLLWIAVRQLRRSGTSVSGLIGFDPERLSRDLGLGVVIAVVASGVVLLSLRAVEPIFGAGEIPFPRWAILWWTLVTSITAGVGEELYFRGFLFERLGRLSAPVLLSVTSLAFAVWHIAPNMLLHTFLLGLGFGWIYLRMGRLFPVVLGHVFTDVLGGMWMLAG